MSTVTLRNDVRCIYDAALRAVDPAKAIRRHVERNENILNIDGIPYNLDHYERCFVVGAGKAGAVMASTMESLLGDRLTGGAINVKYGHTMPLQKVDVIEAAHPIPDMAGVKGTEKIVKILENVGEHDLVFCLLSGGGLRLCLYHLRV